MVRSPVLGRYVVGAVLLQLVGYAALLALVPHSELPSVGEPLRRVPAILLVPVAVVAVPAVVLALVFGALLSAVGVQPTSLLVLISAYVVSVVGLLAYRRVRYR